MKKIPNKITLGGQELQVKLVERVGNNNFGVCSIAGGYIEIANIFDKDKEQSESSKVNTFYHELIHAILGTMGEWELFDNEKFVCSFAGFLTDAMKDAYFKED